MHTPNEYKIVNRSSLSDPEAIKLVSEMLPLMSDPKIQFSVTRVTKNHLRILGSKASAKIYIKKEKIKFIIEDNKLQGIKSDFLICDDPINPAG